MIKRLVKAFYILTIALVVFLGGLLISQGMSMPREEKAAVEEAALSVPQSLIDSQEGNAL